MFFLFEHENKIRHPDIGMNRNFDLALFTELFSREMELVSFTMFIVDAGEEKWFYLSIRTSHSLKIRTKWIVLFSFLFLFCWILKYCRGLSVGKLGEWYSVCIHKPPISITEQKKKHEWPLTGWPLDNWCVLSNWCGPTCVSLIMEKGICSCQSFDFFVFVSLSVRYCSNFKYKVS